MQDLITQFGLDWKLLLAQVVNFLILLYILKRFAYKPILKVLRERRENIAAGLKASEESVKRLEDAEEIKKQVVLQAEQKAVGIVSQAEVIAKDEAQAIITSAHRKEEQIIASSQKRLDEERLKLGEELEQNAEQLVKVSLGKVLGKMPTGERDQALIQEALRELKIASR